MDLFAFYGQKPWFDRALCLNSTESAYHFAINLTQIALTSICRITFALMTTKLTGLTPPLRSYSAGFDRKIIEIT